MNGTYHGVEDIGGCQNILVVGTESVNEASHDAKKCGGRRPIALVGWLGVEVPEISGGSVVVDECGHKRVEYLFRPIWEVFVRS